MMKSQVYQLVLLSTLLITWSQAILASDGFDNLNLEKWAPANYHERNEPPWNCGTDPLGPPPETGVVRRYNFTISRGLKSPDGVEKEMLLVNNQFPGPLIEANWGDIIEVHVHNKIENPQQGTSLHWHGLPQTRTPWYDGVPSIHQCPIAPGESFTYRFIAEVYGTTWWHAHYSAQYTDGAFGPLIIHGPRSAKYDIDVGPVLLSDYIHVDYHSYIMPIYQQPPEFPPIKNNLINGKMPYDCRLPTNDSRCTDDNIHQARFRFETGKIHLLRLINSGGSGIQKFSIDNHDLVVIANDFTAIEPYTTKVVTLGVGQRSDILVMANGKSTDAVWMRSELDVVCLDIPTIQPNATAPIYYTEADIEHLPTSSGAQWSSDGCGNEPLAKTVPLYPKTPPSPDLTLHVNMTLRLNNTGHLLFFMNNSTLYASYGEPILREAYNGRTDFANRPEWNVASTGNASTVRLILQTDFPIQHSMHLHGVSDFWVLAEGWGSWDGRIINPQNPQRRDVQQMLLGSPEMPSYMVIQWESTNPGVWPFHCHILIHSSTGLFMNFLQMPGAINDSMIPRVISETCEAWDRFAAENHVDQPDSGLRVPT
ncbi:multicopper oxidase-domain-containing protein [Stachybotrys elegans]|uniref:Multicopper oxidase-domain-containing protein n=1 Tax=Stachybotrys elegans TaxID=80388 RepID=A0A8K0WME1_9HYPO|nr:multicopper oxidase-domain-containing protein [Stachybotrys elegans]